MATALSTKPFETSEPASGRWHFALAHGLDELDLLEDAWRELGTHVDNPLAQFDWTRSSLTAFDEGDPHVLTLSRGETMLAVAPLVRHRVHGIPRLLLAGVGQIHEPGDFVWSDAAALDRLLSRLALGGAPLLLERLPEDSPALARLKRTYRLRAIVITRPQANCPYIALDETWLEPEEHLNSGRRSDLRRARRKAEQAGAVTTEICTPNLSELPALLDKAFEVEANSWKGEAGTALAHDADRAVFYRQYAEAACVEGILRICFLRIGDRVAAMQLALEHGGGFWLLKVGYDARFSQCSPGMLLMRDTIRYSAEAGLKTYEFLGRAEAWTAVWTKTERRYVSVRVYPLGVRGLSALACDAVAAAYRRWRKK